MKRNYATVIKSIRTIPPPPSLVVVVASIDCDLPDADVTVDNVRIDEYQPMLIETRLVATFSRWDNGSRPQRHATIAAYLKADWVFEGEEVINDVLIVVENGLCMVPVEHLEAIGNTSVALIHRGEPERFKAGCDELKTIVVDKVKLERRKKQKADTRPATTAALAT